MEYTVKQNRIAVRLDAGDEICECIKTIAKKENVKAGSVLGIGGAGEISLGIFDAEAKQYNIHEYTGTHEITALVGNITRVEDEPYLHLHITAASEGSPVIAGHLFSAKISLTAEIYIDRFETEIGRKRNEELGINEMKF